MTTKICLPFRPPVNPAGSALHRVFVQVASLGRTQRKPVSMETNEVAEEDESP